MNLNEWNARLHGLVIFRALLDDDVIAKLVDLTDRMAAHGFHAICFNSETAFIPAAVIHRLSFRFKHIILDRKSTRLNSSHASKSRMPSSA